VEPAEPVTDLDDLEVALVRRVTGQRVEVVDPRCGLELLSLSPAQALQLVQRVQREALRAPWDDSTG
jgi:hypothetical protein